MKVHAFVASLPLLVFLNVQLAYSKGDEWTFNFLRSSEFKKNQKVIFSLYVKGSTYDAPEVYNSYDIIIPFKQLSLKKPILILIHGWKGHGKDVFTTTMLEAHLSYTDSNVITADWSGLGSKDIIYPIVCDQVPKVASIVAAFLDSLQSQFRVKLEDIHILGHSLGAHVAGMAGYLVKNGKIGRITGLDPAGPMFTSEDPSRRLSSDSANFVDIIHTSSNFLGFGNPIGHVDFYPNGPHMIQPGCGLDIIGRCSHRRSYYFYAESLGNPQAFLAVPCTDWVQFQKKECDVQKVIPMGVSTPPTARGTYFLSTNANSPYGTGNIWSS